MCNCYECCERENAFHNQNQDAMEYFEGYNAIVGRMEDEDDLATVTAEEIASLPELLDAMRTDLSGRFERLINDAEQSLKSYLEGKEFYPETIFFDPD